MLRRIAAVATVFVLFVGIALADELRVVITKVDGDKITAKEVQKKGKFGDEKTYTAAKDLKVVKGKFNKETKKLEAGDAVEGGLKADTFTKIGEKGVGATITTDGDKVTQIIVGGRGK